MKLWYWFLLLLLFPLYSQANPVDDKHIQVALHSEVQSVKPGEPFWIGLRLTPDKHWHTYWKNPGDSGAAPKVKWTLPEGTQAGDIQWPAPHRIPVSHLVNFGYDGEVLLPIQISPPDTLTADTFAMTANLSWLVCKEICIPGNAQLKLDIPVSTDPPEKDSRWAKQFAKTRGQLPEALSTPSQLVQTDNGFRLIVDIPEQLQLSKRDQVWFYPVDNDLIEHATPQPWMRDAGQLSIQLETSPYFTQLKDKYEGLLVLNEKAYQLTTPAAVQTAAQAAQFTPIENTPTPSTSFWLIGLLAFAGGLLLNLMPCVLPVLSLKALSLVQHGQSHQSQQRMHGLAYTVGVVLSFVLIAAVLLALRAGGEQIGWGFQLQSPLFIALLIYLLFALGLSLSGLFNVGSSWMGFGDSLSQKSGYTGSFFTGVLAVLVASPCTAPFMGTALGYAITQSAAEALSVFAMLGLGMALPFLLLSFVPGWLRFLPKPGAWMETFKQLMAFPLYATALWLLWVLGRQVGVNGMTAALGGLILLALALWLISSQTRLWRKIAFVIALLSSFAMLALPVFSPTGNTSEAVSDSATGGLNIEAYTPKRLQALRNEQKPVFVNLTADWCITCLVNEQVALNQPEVQQAFEQNNVTYLKGDWTNRDSAITRLLSEHDRSGVPLYLFYAAGKQAEILPQILTPSLVINALNSK